MAYKIFGTIKQIKCNSKSEVMEITIVPTQDFTIKGTTNNKKIALIRPKDDIGRGILFEYAESIVVTGKSLKSLSSVLTTGRVAGFVFNELEKRTKGDIKLTGTDNKAGIGGSYIFCEVDLV